MEVMRFAESIYTSELAKCPHLELHKDIILASAILHDMCDHKYISDEAGGGEKLKFGNIWERNFQKREFEI